MPIVAAALLALMTPAEVPKAPAKDLFLHIARAPGVEVRFADYHYQAALFEAMQKGDSAVPEATRNWVVARVVLETRPLTLDGARLGVGNYGLVLWPNLDGKGMMVEMRQIDMRELYPDLNAIAPAPKGETVYKGPARFEASSEMASRLTIALEGKDGGFVLTLHYGTQVLRLAFTR